METHNLSTKHGFIDEILFTGIKFDSLCQCCPFR